MISEHARQEIIRFQDEAAKSAAVARRCRFAVIDDGDDARVQLCVNHPRDAHAKSLCAVNAAYSAERYALSRYLRDYEE